MYKGDFHMDLLQEYKDLYYREIEFKDSMNTKIGTSITFLTVLCTGHMFIWDIMVDLNYILHIVPILFLSTEALSVIYTVFSLYNFYKTYFKYEYHLVSAEKIEKAIAKNNSLSAHYSSKEIADANYCMMCQTFYDCTVHNRNENLRKNGHHIKLSSSLVKAIITLIITYTIWIFLINPFTF